MPFDYSNLKRVAIEALVIICFGFTIGLAVNYRMVMNAFEGKVVTTAAPAGSESTQGFPVPVTLDEVFEKRSRSLLVDARITELYETGHIPGAVSFPLEAVDKGLADFRQRNPATRPIIVYCSGYGCSDSFDLAMILIENGYHDVMVFEGGYPEWRDAGLPVVTGEAP